MANASLSFSLVSRTGFSLRGLVGSANPDDLDGQEGARSRITGYSCLLGQAAGAYSYIRACTRYGSVHRTTLMRFPCASKTFLVTRPIRP